MTIEELRRLAGLIAGVYLEQFRTTAALRWLELAADAGGVIPTTTC